MLASSGSFQLCKSVRASSNPVEINRAGLQQDEATNASVIPFHGGSYLGKERSSLWRVAC